MGGELRKKNKVEIQRKDTEERIRRKRKNGTIAVGENEQVCEDSGRNT